MDIWPIPKPIYTQNWTKSFQNYPMNSEIAGVADLFVKNNSWRVSKKRRMFNQLSNGNTLSDFDRFNQPPKMIPHKDHRGLIVVIRKLDGSPLDVGVSGTTPNQVKGTFNFPSIQSANEIGSNLQHFFV